MVGVRFGCDLNALDCIRGALGCDELLEVVIKAFHRVLVFRLANDAFGDSRLAGSEAGAVNLRRVDPREEDVFVMGCNLCVRFLEQLHGVDDVVDSRSETCRTYRCRSVIQAGEGEQLAILSH